jgi:PAS domain-containing protein
MSDARLSPEADAFIAAVEKLVKRRHTDLRKQSPKRRYREERRVFDAPKRFTFEELSIYFPWFRELRKQRKQGVFRRPPKREDVLALGGAYQCELSELNVLLASAGYAPEVTYLEGEELDTALSSIERAIRYLPVPGFVVTRDLSIRKWNDSALKMFGISQDAMAAMSVTERNLLRFIFDPSTPVYRSLTGSMKSWEHSAWLNVYRFKEENLLCQYDDWYIDTYEYLRQFPKFDECWDATHVGAGFKEFTPPQHYETYKTEVSMPGGEVAHLQAINAFDTTADDYPRAILYIPVDEESMQVLTKYGFPTPDNWWGYKSS